MRDYSSLAPGRAAAGGDSRWLGRLLQWGRPTGILLICGLIATFAGLLLSSWLLLRAVHDNRMIDHLAAGQDVAVDVGARPELQMARAHFLIRRGRLDEAQALVPAVRASGDRWILATLHYDLANARLRMALALLDEMKIDPAVPLINLAKEGYRAAISLEPDLWDARYNLDVAMRLVRDFPEIEQSSEEPPLETPEQLWTDLPGLPRGLP